MDVNVVWNSKMAFTAHGEEEFTIPLDAEMAVGGDGRGFKPMELIAIGLAGCTAMDVISILQKKRQKVNKFEVSVDAARSHDHPKVFTNAIITFKVTGNEIEESAVLRAIELSATKYCPVHAMLEQAFPINMQYEIYEEDENNHPRLTYSGVWNELLFD